jgi:Cdc6-like AAA superfamily ATPase
LSEEKRRKIISWLSPRLKDSGREDQICPNYYQERYAELMNDRLKSSCSWILEDRRFQDWEESKSNESIVWVHGPPGFGKSTVTATVLDHMQSTLLEDIILYFFIDGRGNACEKTEPVAILRSLVFQLYSSESLSNPSKTELVRNAMQKMSGALGQATDFNTLSKLFCDLLSLVQGETVRIVLDGADECTDIKPILDILHKILKDEKLKLQVVLTSKETTTLITQMGRFCPIEVTVSAEKTSTDIKRYIEHRIRQIFGSVGLEALEPRIDTMIKTLTISANGMYSSSQFLSDSC